MLKTLELFSGIGGIRLGFESVGGFDFAQAVEISPTARAVYSHYFDTPIWDDVRTFHSKPGQFDCIIGGSPCQDLSACGKKQGLNGDRSSLWWEMLRIIDECKPSFVGWENVEGALSRGCREVVAGLRMVGYEVEDPIIVSAAELGAPHLRKRIFLAAYAKHLSSVFKEPIPRWEEQIREFLKIARTSHSQSQRRKRGFQQRQNGWNEFNRLLASDSSSQRFQGNITQQESESIGNTAGQFKSFSPLFSVAQSSSMGLDDGISSELVRRGTDVPWLSGVRRSGWWTENQPPAQVGLPDKRIPGRRASVNHYGAACIPAQAIPLALRIKYLFDLTERHRNERQE